MGCVAYGIRQQYSALVYHRNKINRHRHNLAYHRRNLVYHRNKINRHRHNLVYHRRNLVYHRNKLNYHRHNLAYHRLDLVYHRNKINYHRQNSTYQLHRSLMYWRFSSGLRSRRTKVRRSRSLEQTPVWFTGRSRRIATLRAPFKPMDLAIHREHFPLKSDKPFLSAPPPSVSILAMTSLRNRNPQRQLDMLL